MIGFLADDIHHIVDGDATKQPTLRIDHGSGNQIAVFEQFGDVAGPHVGIDGGRLIHDFPDGALRIVGQQAGDIQRA